MSFSWLVNLFIVSKVRNAQFTFEEKPQIVHTWLDKVRDSLLEGHLKLQIEESIKVKLDKGRKDEFKSLQTS